MIYRLERTLLYMLLVIIFGACGTENEAADQPIPLEMGVSYMATIGKGETRTIYTEAEDVTNSNRPYLKALWGGENETKETITLYAADGTYCNFTATIPAGGKSEVEFIGYPEKEDFNPVKAYYNKGVSVSSLATPLDLTNQIQGASGSTAHISGQDFMAGNVTLPNGNSANTGSIQFNHLTAVVKYSLDFSENKTAVQSEISESEAEEPQPLQVKLLSLRQKEGESVLKLKQSFDNTSVSVVYSRLDLNFKENNAAVLVPIDNPILEAYVSIFPSSTKDKKFTLFAQTTTGFYESAEFIINQNFEAGKLYTITTAMQHLAGYDWYMNPEVDEEGNQVYTISNAEELAAFANIVNGDVGMTPDSFDGKIVQMTSSISLKDYQPWTPIGKSADTPFKGTFDGCNNTVSDLKTDPNKDYQGFFGFVDGATIKNLTIEGEVEGQNYVGAVAAYATNSTFEDCTFGNPNFSNFHVSGLNWVGSVIGYAKGSVFEICVNYGSVTGGTNGYVGGLGGGSDDSSLRGCTNYGGVAVGDGGCGGGLMGLMNGGYISGCANHGEMTSVAGMIASILANIAGEMANSVQIIGSYSDGMNDGAWGFGTGDYIVNGSYYTEGKGDDEWYRESLGPEDYANMNELINGEGYGFDEDGSPIDTNPTDFGHGNVNDFSGGGYLK